MNAPAVLEGIARMVAEDAAKRIVVELLGSPDAWEAHVVDPTTKAFGRHMAASFDAVIYPKADAVPMRAVAALFDVTQFFDVHVPNGETFLHRFATTLGNVIFVPAEVLSGDPAVLFDVLTHECEHVAQFRRAGFAMPWLYATSAEARAAYEANAYGSGLSIRHATTGGLPATDADIAPSLATSYHLGESDVSLAVDMLRSHAASADSGIVTTEAARVALDWLRANAPQWVRP